jgi:DNA-directed RNA polymerase subunit RPC12/RpoP
MSNYRDRYNEDGFAEYIQEIIDGEHLDGAALGIAKQVADRGLDSLSDKQKYVFERDVMSHYYVEECERCGNEIPWEEMYQATDSNYCSYCEHMYQKMLAE